MCAQVARQPCSDSSPDPLRVAGFAQIKVEPNRGEERDANFPRNLHNAAELLLNLGDTPARTTDGATAPSPRAMGGGNKDEAAHH